MSHDHELGYLLRISRLFDVYRRQQIQSSDLYPALLTCLSYVCRHPGRSQKQMSQHLCLDKTTIAHHVANLEDKGYLRREPSQEDGRVLLLYPTEKAEALTPRLHETYETFYDSILSGFTPEERAQIGQLSARMVENARCLTQREGGTEK